MFSINMSSIVLFKGFIIRVCPTCTRISENTVSGNENFKSMIVLYSIYTTIIPKAFCA